MSIRIAVIADIHLSDAHGTAQEASLTYALSRLQAEEPDVVLVLGDATAAGTLESAERVRTMLEESGLCFRMVHGNSDERTPDVSSAVMDRLTVAAPFCSHEFVVCLLDFHHGRAGTEGLRSLKALMEGTPARKIVLGSHYPLVDCMEDPEVHSLIASGKASLFVGAHLHGDEEYKDGEMSVCVVRGLDPDKAIGAPPAVTLFEFKDGAWRTDHIPFEDGTVANWSPRMRQEFIDYLGFSCMAKTLAGLECAATYNVRCVELRAQNALSVPREKCLDAVGRWRDLGGTHLSIHMPELKYDDGTSAIQGVPAFRDAVTLASTLGADQLVLHAPRVSKGRMQPGSEIWDRFAATFLDLLKGPIARRTVIGVENLHMNRGDATDDSRGFGCLPAECREWMASLREAAGTDRIGIHLDIGHARNNPPFSRKYAVGRWYALVGRDIVGYHLHQVTLADGGMANHQPFTDVYGPLISLSSFFWGWKTGGLRHAPMYLEIRSDRLEDTIESLRCIRQHVSGTSSPWRSNGASAINCC